MQDTLVAQLGTLKLPEIIAVVAAVAYLLLAVRQHMACWFFALLSTAIYIALFIGARLYMESLLHVFYFAMAVYGWYCWRSGDGRGGNLAVTTLPASRHVTAVVGITALALATGALLDRYTDAAWPYVDSLTTYGAFWATFLVARKVLENWWYWLVIDAISVWLYWTRDLHLTAMLFVAYLAIIPFGLLAWTRAFRARAVAA